MSNSSNSYCTFMVDGLCCGIDVSRVQEVIRFQELTHVPLGGCVVRGLMNLRGKIVTALDLRRRIGLCPADGLETPQMNVVIRHDEGPISLLVDEIGDVVQVGQELFEVPPDTLSQQQREQFLGAFKLDDRLLLILDTDRIVDSEN